MPSIWFELPTGTAPAVRRLRNDPAGLEKYVKWVVEHAHDPGQPQPQLIALYFEVGAERACALVQGLDDYVYAKSVARTLGAVGVTKLLDVSQAADAIKRERRLRPPSPKPKRPPRRPGASA